MGWVPSLAAADRSLRALSLTLVLAGCGYPEPFPVASDAGSIVELVEELGGSASGGGVSSRDVDIWCPRIAVDRQGTPYVAWADATTGSREVYLKYWDGQRWAGLGGSDVDGGVSLGAGAPPAGGYASCMGQIAFDSANRPYVAWMNYGGPRQSLYLRWWSGSAWEELGQSATDGGLSGNQSVWWPKLAIDDLDQPVVAWNRGSEIYLTRWNGSTWSGLGGSNSYPGVSGPGAVASLVELALGPGPELFVSWKEARASPVTEVYLKQWNGNAWTELDGSASDGGVSQGATIAEFASVVDDRSGRPLVVWQQGTDAGTQIATKRWNGSAWAPLGGDSSLRQAGMNSQARHPNVALDSSGNPVIVWEQQDGLGWNIYLARWDGASWRGLGAVGDGGVSGTASDSTWPEVGVDAEGSVYVTWYEEVSPGLDQVYVKRIRSSFIPTPVLEPGRYEVGCDCQAVPSSLAFAAIALCCLARRRRPLSNHHDVPKRLT